MKLFHSELQGGLADIDLEGLKEELQDGKERLMLGLSNLMLEYYAPEPAPDPAVRMTYSSEDHDLTDWEEELEDSSYLRVERDRPNGSWTTYRDGADRVEFRGEEVVVEFGETIEAIPGYEHLDDLDRIGVRAERDGDLFIEYDEQRPRHFSSDSPYRIT